jgi:hypothetical protein
MTKLVLDEDVKVIAEFAQARFAADRLVGISAALNTLAPSLWGHHGTAPVVALRILPESMDDVTHKLSSAIESAGAAGVRDGSAAATDAPA